MINPAKYYNPKLIPLGEPVLCWFFFFVLSWTEGYVSMNVVMGYLVALRWAHSVQGDENGKQTIYIFFLSKLFKTYR